MLKKIKEILVGTDLGLNVFQIKRPQAKEYFARAISDMYAELSKSDPTMQKMWRAKT